MPYLHANGIRIHYLRTGGAKPPLLLCHGITDSARCWPRLAPILSQDYDLIMLDARGHGLSDAPETGYTWQALADDVVGVIKQMKLHRPGILGHSMGAATAALAAATAPGLIGFLILEDPPWRAEADPTRMDAMMADYRQRILDRRTMTMRQMIVYTACRDRGVQRWDKSEFAPWSAAKRRVSLNVAKLLATAAPAYRGIAPLIACPTLLITADPSRGAIVTPEIARDAAALNPNIRVATIADTGHNVRRESFEQYVSAVQSFLHGLPAKPD